MQLGQIAIWNATGHIS